MPATLTRKLARAGLALALGGASCLGLLALVERSSAPPLESRVAAGALARGEAFLVREARADGEDAGDRVIARVGQSVLTVRDVERALSETPRAELAKLGDSPEAIRRAFVERVLLRDLVLAEEARARGLDKLRDIRDRSLSVLRLMLVQNIRAETKADAVTKEDVEAYFQSHQDKFAAPKRIGIFRILVSSEGEAKELLEELGTTPDPKRWNDLARDKSLDKSTHIRGGNLGMVAQDGTTGKAEAKVDTALYVAADAVKDGELVTHPVKEGDKWAVVWKRQTMRASTRSLEIEAPTIRTALADERMRTGIQDLLEKLRASEIKELNAELCDMITVTAQGELERTKRPGTLPRSKRPANATPIEGPGGLR